MENLSWIKGRHTFRFGYTFNRYNKTENADGAQGSFGFTNAGAPTGTSAFQQSWANFLLGNVSTFTMPSQDVTPNVWTWQHELYAQDDFKVTPHLTLYMGVRWSLFQPPTDSTARWTTSIRLFTRAAASPAVNPANGNYVTPIAQLNPPTNGIIVGGKNSPFGDKVTNYELSQLRAPHRRSLGSVRRRQNRHSRRLWNLSTIPRCSGPTNRTSSPIRRSCTSVSYANASFSNVAGGAQGIITAPITLHATQLPALTPYSQQWNLTIEHQFAQAGPARRCLRRH